MLGGVTLGVLICVALLLGVPLGVMLLDGVIEGVMLAVLDGLADSEVDTVEEGLQGTRKLTTANA